MPELDSSQLVMLQRFVERGFGPASFSRYPNAIGIRRGSFAALLELTTAGHWRQVGEPYYVLEENLAVCIEAQGKRWFVWKNKRVEATAALLLERQKFLEDLTAALPALP